MQTRFWMTMIGMSLSALMTTSAFQAQVIAGPKTEARAALEAQFSLGVLNGDAEEIVYDYDRFGGRRKLSQLDWDLKDIVMGGAQISARVTERLSLNGGLWVALTEGTGEMDDYDWGNPASSSWTDYSLSEVDVTEGYILDVNAAWDFMVTDPLALRGVLGYKQNGWTWEDRGVYALYPEFGYIPYLFYGENLIDYEQEFQIPYLGLAMDGSVGAFTLSGYVNWSPLVFASDWDHHIARGIKFEETFKEGDMLGAGLEARYLIEEGFFAGVFLGASLQHQKIDEIIGDMKYHDYITGDRGIIKDSAGISSEYTAFMLSGGFNF